MTAPEHRDADRDRATALVVEWSAGELGPGRLRDMIAAAFTQVRADAKECRDETRLAPHGGPDIDLPVPVCGGEQGHGNAHQLAERMTVDELRSTLARLTGYAEDSRTVQAFIEVAQTFAAEELRAVAATALEDRVRIGVLTMLRDRADELDPR